MLTAFRLKDMPGLLLHFFCLFSKNRCKFILLFIIHHIFSKENDCLSKNLCYNLEQFTGFPKLESYDG